MIFETGAVEEDDGVEPLDPLDPELMSISGEQDGNFVILTMSLGFRDTKSTPIDVHYLAPNNSKVGIYGTTFRLGPKVIVMSLEDKGAGMVAPWMALYHMRSEAIPLVNAEDSSGNCCWQHECCIRLQHDDRRPGDFGYDRIASAEKQLMFDGWKLACADTCFHSSQEIAPIRLYR